MKKFRLEITRTDEYHFDVDENIWDEAALKDYSNTFSTVETIPDLLENLAFQVMRFGSDKFYEGFGYVREIDHNGKDVKQYGNDHIELKESDYCQGITMTLVSEDDEFDYDTKEILNKTN